jgi:hypothetical protein
MQNPVPPDLTLATTTVLFIFIGVAITESIVVIAAITGFCYAMTHISYKHIKKSNQKDSIILSQVAKLIGYNVHNCGCVYEKNYSVGRTNVPESEWMEQEKVYERSIEGAKVRFDKRKSGMKRCTQCGNHYHTVESIRSNKCRHSRICWPEEEPDVREELDHRVIEA